MTKTVLKELSPLLALGAAASVPMVVASEHFNFGSKQLGHLVRTLLADTQGALPAASSSMERLAALLTEASETLSGREAPGAAVPSQQQQQQQQRQQETSAAAVLASMQQQQQQQHAGSLAAMPLLQQQQRRQQELQQVAAAQLGTSSSSSSSSPGLLDTVSQEEQLAALERQHSAASTLSKSGVDPPGHAASLHRSSAHSRRKPEAAELAVQFPGDVAAMRAALAELGLSQLPDRFSDAELMRYAVTKGYLAATTPEQRQRALRQGATMAARTADWLTCHQFSSQEQLQAFSHLLRWEGPDPQGHPVLRISIGRAVEECRGPAAAAFANAIVTQLQYAVEGGLLGDGPVHSAAQQGSGSSSSEVQSEGGAVSADSISSGVSSVSSGSSSGVSNGSQDERPSRIVVVMDCSGCTALAATRITGVFKAACAALNHHYPQRLHELVLLDLPSMLTWLVAGVRKLMHPETRGKVRLVRNGKLQPLPAEE